MTGDGPRAPGPVAQARAACAARTWEVARAAFARADEDGEPLSAADLEGWGLAALLAGDDRQSDAARERAHHAFLAADDRDGASRVAFWLALTLLMRGEHARARGWFERPRSIVGDAGFAATVWHGYERLNLGMRALAEGQDTQSRDLLADAVAVAREHADPDLELLARNGHGQALLALGRTAEGMAELDEVMVLATTGTAGPQAVGQVYCAAILVCRGCLDLGRSAEWTEALSRWCAGQPGIVHYRGQCAVHRSEVLQLRGQWAAATDEVTAVLDRCARDPGRRDPARGMAHYQRGELHRVRGETRAAEEAYRAAAAAGLDPQPGLALLRAAQGRASDATAALARASAEAAGDFLRGRLLPAQVEVALAAGDGARARAASAELAALA
ncbi:DNA-binding response regulator, partial [Isoptericola sp. NPDC057191]|uniref:DNA-binding response regulator n=1 Tax=Isoptericola sp. NPDC057191 TaxID=3346041 RepID=UPI00363CF52A